MAEVRKAYLQLHIAVLLYGFTAILGDLISLSAPVLVWWRVFFTSLSFFFLFPVFARLKALPRGLIWRFMGIGVLIALHWITFFGSIKYANPSVCLVCMATTSFFTAILEPSLLRQKHKWYEFVLGLLIIPGMILVVRGLQIDMWVGVLLGLVSAFLASLFSILNKKYIHRADPQEITFVELGSAWLFISLLLPFILRGNVAFLPEGMDWAYLLVLSLLCTTFAYVLSLKALKHISAFAATLTINLEPVYGILLAFFFLNDAQELDHNFYLGCLVILLSVFAYPVIQKRINRKKSIS
ncbi:MAG: DMT family transporter [Saprospiraceae bacterium]|nr:DMT family transporter [Saprospiraceae bacterium]